MKRNSITAMMQDDDLQVSEIKLKGLTLAEKERKQKEDKASTGDYSQFGEEILDIKNSISRDHADLLQKNIKLDEVKMELRSIIEVLVIDKFNKFKISTQRQQDIVIQILQSLNEYGPITDLYYTPGVTDVHIKRFDFITFKKNGIIYPSAVRFSSEEELKQLIEKLVRDSDELNTRQINWKKPILNGKLRDGGRFNAMISPVALQGSTLHLRKHREGFFTAEQLKEKQTLTEAILMHYDCTARGRINTMIVGGGGTGKTEMLRLYASFYPDGLNIDTIEDTEELHLELIKENVRTFEFRNLTEEEIREGMIGTASDIIRWGSLRSDIDLIVQGEILSSLSLLDQIDAMSIGQPGSAGTFHADGPEAFLVRAISMYAAQMPNLSENFIMRHIASALEQIITVQKYPGGSLKVSRITQLSGIKNGEFVIQDLYRYDPRYGHYRTSIPMNRRFREKFILSGVDLPHDADGNPDSPGIDVDRLQIEQGGQDQLIMAIQQIGVNILEAAARGGKLDV